MSTKMQVVERLIDSWRRRSADDFLACLTDDVEYHYHMGSKPVRGKDRMRKFLANYGAAYDQRSWRIFNHAENGDLLLVEGHEELYDLKHERLIQQPFMQAYEFRNGAIARMRDYYEPANLRAPATAGSASDG